MTIGVLWALLYMALGAALMGAANWFGWKKYYDGKMEGRRDGHADVQREVTRRQSK